MKQSKFHNVTLDTCIFRENIGFAGTIFISGQVSVTCKHSIIHSNRVFPCVTAVMMLSMNNSKILITNTTFENNSCRPFWVFLNGTSSLRIEDSTFVRNRNMDGSSGAIEISFVQNIYSYYPKQINSPDKIFKAVITNVLFQENIAPVGSVLSTTEDGVLLTNCTFFNNFARFQGGQVGNRGSSDLKLVHSVFKQTIPKIFASNGTEFVASSFLRLYGTGKVEVYNTTFDCNTESVNEPMIVVPTAEQISFDNSSLTICPLAHAIEKINYNYYGSGNRHVNSLTLSCKKCDYDLYSLQRGMARGLNVEAGFQCLSCPRGASCFPGIKSKANFWGYKATSNPPTLAFTICPFGYCKSPRSNSTEYSACQGTGFMCGMCSPGYSEALWSTYCTSLRDCNDRWFWIVFLVFVFFMAVLLVFKPPFVKYSLKQIFWFKMNTGSRFPNSQASSYRDINRYLDADEETGQNNALSPSEQIKQDKRQFSRFVEIIFHFYQIAQLLLWSASLSEFFETKFLTPVLGFFNFQPGLIKYDKHGFVCPFPGLTPKTKLLFKIVPVFGTLAAIFLLYSLHVFICRTRGALRPAISPYLQASIKTVFLGYVTLATVSISLIRCVSVAGKTRWFYNGNVLCYQWWQFASFIFNAIFVIPFIFVLAWLSFKLHHDKITVRQFLLAIVCPLSFLALRLFRTVFPSEVGNAQGSENLNALKEMLLGPYKQPNDRSKRGALYWQSILIARRFILVLIFCVVTEPSFRLFCMTLVCVFVLCFHLKVKPFQNSLSNNFESLSLLSLIVLALINLFKSVFAGFEQNIKGSLVTIFKAFQWLEIVILGLFPILLLLLLCFAMISIFARVVFMCSRFMFKRFSRHCFKRCLPPDSARLVNVCDSIDDE